MKTHIIVVAMRDTGEELERAEVRAEEAIVAAAAAEMVANYMVTPGSHRANVLGAKNGRRARKVSPGGRG